MRRCTWVFRLLLPPGHFASSVAKTSWLHGLGVCAATLLVMVPPLAITGCFVEPEDTTEPIEYVPERGPQIPTGVVPSPALPAQAFLDRTLDLRNYSDGQLDEIAACPAAVFQLRLLLSVEGAAVVDELRRRNPNIIVIGLHPVLSLPEHWDHENQRQRFPMTAELYDLLTPYGARTNQGDIAWRWPGNVTIDPWRRGGLNVDLLRAQMDVIARHARQHPRAIDGIFHDFLSEYPWLYAGENPVRGETDFDGDGIPTKDDADERGTWVDWQLTMLDELQSRFGPGLIQVANGRLPHVDPIAAGKIAGIVYEFFPNTPWWVSDQEGLELVLTHSEPGYLTPRRGHLWNLLWDTNGDHTDFSRVASALTDGLYMLRDTAGFPGRDPQIPTLGDPQGPLVQTPLDGGQTRYSRPFDRGSAVIETWASGRSGRVEFELTP